MNVVQNSIPDTITSSPRELGRLLLVYWRRWVVTTLLFTAAAAAYALVASKSWQSSLALIVRNEAVISDADAAHAHGPEELKSLQETIVELAKSRSVLHGALAEVGPPADRRQTTAWPSDADIESLQKNVKIAPPKGIELGTTEVFYLEVRDKNRQRVLELSTAVLRQLQRQLQELRDGKAQSMVDELEKAVQVAKADLKTATERLTAFEQEVGSDLPELRSLLDSNSSDTSLRRTITEIESELRQCRAAEAANRQLLGLLDEAEADPSRLVAAPSRLLDSQPALRRLKDGLIDAQIHTATLEGRMSVDHPEVISAGEAEDQVAARLHAELSTAVRGVEAELAFAISRIQFLEHQREQNAACLDRLAGLRASYTNLLSETTNRAKLLERAEQSLTVARSTSAGAKAGSLIAAVDSPDTGANPVSPSSLTIVLGGMLGGLVAGIGIVFLTVPAAARANADSSRISTVSLSTTVVVPYCVTEVSPPVPAVAASGPWDTGVESGGKYLDHHSPNRDSRS